METVLPFSCAVHANELVVRPAVAVDTGRPRANWRDLCGQDRPPGSRLIVVLGSLAARAARRRRFAAAGVVFCAIVDTNRHQSPLSASLDEADPSSSRAREAGGDGASRCRS